MSKAEDIEAIVAKAEDKLKTARLDFVNGQYDDAVSRAYYAVYHMLTAVLFRHGRVYSSHAQTIGAFKGLGINRYTRFYARIWVSFVVPD